MPKRDLWKFKTQISINPQRLLKIVSRMEKNNMYGRVLHDVDW